MLANVGVRRRSGNGRVLPVPLDRDAPAFDDDPVSRRKLPDVPKQRPRRRDHAERQVELEALGVELWMHEAACE